MISHIINREERTMPIDIEGKEILKEPLYDRLRQEIINEIMSTIDSEGKYGEELRISIEKVLKKQQFKGLVDKLINTLQEEKGISASDGPQTLSMLVEEDLANDIKENLQGQIEDTHVIKGKRKRIYKVGKKVRLWEKIPSRYLGEKSSLLRDIANLIKENNAIKSALLIGAFFLVVSSILFKSVYKAIIAGLTLSAFSGSTTIVANILGALGGILIFFVSLSLILQHIVLAKSRDEQIHRLASRYLERRERERG
jgi:hypothetical protein